MLLLGPSGVYKIESDKLLEWNAVKQLQCIAPATRSVFILLSDEVVQPMEIETPPRESRKVIEIDDDGRH